MRHYLALTAIFMTTFFAGSSTIRLRAQDSKTKVRPSGRQLKDLIANAKEPAEHQKLATFYRQEAARLRQQAKEHQDAADMYTRGQAGYAAKNPNTNGAVHCGNWAKLEGEAAKEAEELATMHEDMAKEVLGTNNSAQAS